MTIEELHTIFLTSSGVSTDSRKIGHSCIYFSLKGDNFDGNAYAEESIEKGAMLAIVDAEDKVCEGCVFFENGLKALQDLANYHRNYLEIPILAITGSNGKTTTKELCAQVLSEKFQLAYTAGNYNNHIGVPLTLLSFTKDLEFGIVEMGANHVEEIAALCAIAEPNYALITNIGKAHIGEFGGVEQIKKAKLELFDYINTHGGTFFYNEAYNYFLDLVIDKAKLIAYSDFFSNGLEFKLIGTEPLISYEFGGTSEQDIVKTQLGGIHNVENLKAAIAIGLHFGLDPHKINKAISSFIPTANRSQWIDADRNKVFLDAYNANPTSVSMAIDYFESLGDNKKLIIIGDMLELGEYEKQEHNDVYQRLSESSMEFLLVGPIFYGANNEPRVYASKKDLSSFIASKKYDDYVVLIKASRGMRLEELLPLF